MFLIRRTTMNGGQITELKPFLFKTWDGVREYLGNQIDRFKASDYSNLTHWGNALDADRTGVGEVCAWMHVCVTDFDNGHVVYGYEIDNCEFRDE